MKANKKFLIAGVQIFAAAAQISAHPELTETEILNLHSQIRSVALGGFWRRDNEKGSYRLIAVDQGWAENTYTSFFIQWIKMDTYPHGIAVEKMKRIPELDGYSLIDEPRSLENDKETDYACRFELTGEQRGTDIQKAITLTVFPNHTYSISLVNPAQKFRHLGSFLSGFLFACTIISAYTLVRRHRVNQSLK